MNKSRLARSIYGKRKSLPKNQQANSNIILEIKNEISLFNLKALGFRFGFLLLRQIKR